MTRLKKRFLILISFLFLVLIFRGPIFRITVKYESIGQRDNYTLSNPKIIQEIKKTTNQEKLSLDEMIHVALKICAKQFRFSLKQHPSDPNNLIASGKANCIGYSALFNSIISYIATQQGQEEIVQSTQLIGKIYFLGIDIHRFFKSSFFKDHDFNQIINLEHSDTLYIDPSMYDYLRIKRLRTTVK